MESSDPVFHEIGQAIREHESFLVVSHLRPDGDALGCQIALGLCLRQLGKTVTVWNHDGVTESYRYLPCSDLVSKPAETKQDFDVVIALDCSSFARLGSAPDSVRDAKLWINIDHHVSNERYGDLVLIDGTAPATGQILYELFLQEDLPITYEMADCLFVAISTDTGSFQYPNTTARSFEIGADLIRKGVNVGALSQSMYDSYPRRRIELLRALLNVLKFSCDDRVASFTLTQEMARTVGSRPEDTEGLIDHLRAVEGVLVAAFIEELPDGNVRVSMRSKDPRFDVCRICQTFGGGGHALAAGARLPGPVHEAEERILEGISNEIRQSN
jgi:phosphoesterase RecJ-like protein